MKASTLLIALLFGSSAPANVASPSANIAVPDSEIAEIAEITTPTAVATPLLDPYGIYGADDNESETILDALATFADAGLDLPELRIYVHRTPDRCGGNLGLFHQGGDMQRIDICIVHPRLITHELAHAWEHHAIDEATRKDFMELADADVWNDHSVAHDSRGIELAADAIVWGLETGEISSMSGSHYADDIARFVLLTGNQPARVVEPVSAAPEATAASSETVGLALEAMQPTMQQS